MSLAEIIEELPKLTAEERQAIYRRIEVVRLDDFLDQIPSLQLVKIDVEGGEIGCLRGAAKLLRRRRPFVAVEYGAQSHSVYGHARRTLFDFAESIDFVVGDLFGAVCPDFETWDVVCDKVYWDWFLVPRERIGECQSHFQI